MTGRRRGKKYITERTKVKGSKVVITKLPVVRCAVCGKQMAHQPGKAAKVLTSHYNKEHC